jgi:rhamnosyl/mannosyltransferase
MSRAASVETPHPSAVDASLRILQSFKVYRPDVDGGIVDVIANINRLKQYGDEVRILVARRQGRRSDYIWDQTPVTAVASLGQVMSMPIAPTFPMALRRMTAASDVLALHAPFPLNDLAVAPGIAGHIAVIVHWHAEILGRGAMVALLRPLMEHTLRRADRIIVSDQSIADKSPFLRPHLSKCDVVPYGTDVAYWSSLTSVQQQKVAQLKQQYPRLVTTVGRLVPYKGHAVLLKAMVDIDATLMIIGEGVEHARLTAMAHDLGLADRVHFMGFLERDEIKTLLHASGVFAFPSITAAETFGIVQIEAMAAGCAIVNTNLDTAVPRVARHFHEGLTVQSGDACGLAVAIRSILDDPARASRMSTASRQRASDLYSNEAFIARIRSIYQQAAAKRVQTARP